MPKTDWTDIFRAKIEEAGSSRTKRMTLAREAQLDDFAEKFAAAMERNSVETSRGIAIIEAHMLANGGTLDLDNLETMLKTGPSDTTH